VVRSDKSIFFLGTWVGVHKDVKWRRMGKFQVKKVSVVIKMGSEDSLSQKKEYLML
jgi:hypothetical protein